MCQLGVDTWTLLGCHQPVYWMFSLWVRNGSTSALAELMSPFQFNFFKLCHIQIVPCLVFSLSFYWNQFFLVQRQTKPAYWSHPWHKRFHNASLFIFVEMDGCMIQKARITCHHPFSVVFTENIELISSIISKKSGLERYTTGNL